MALVAFWLAIYLYGSGKWGRSLRAKNTTLARRRVYGVLAASPWIIYGMLLVIPPSFSLGGVLLAAFFVLCGALGYVTVVHAPRWIVGGRQVYVISCNHGIQPGGLLAQGDGADALEQRRHFTNLLEDIIRRRGITFIGEEQGFGEETIADLLGVKYSIPVKDINTQKSDKQRMGIPCDYLSGEFAVEQKSRWDRQREEFMLARIQENRGAARNILVLCGFVHLEPLSGLLGKDSAVRQIDYRKYEWYRAGVFAGD